MLFLLYRRMIRKGCLALVRTEPLSRNAESEWGGRDVEYALRRCIGHQWTVSLSRVFPWYRVMLVSKLFLNYPGTVRGLLARYLCGLPCGDETVINLVPSHSGCTGC